MTPSTETPVVYMLCGLTGSGKTTFAAKLEREGAARLSIDEFVFERYGRHGIDYPEHDYPKHEAEARVDLDRRLVELVAAGQTVVLDYGFWSRSWRDEYKELIESVGGHWELLYFKVDIEVLRARLARRDERNDANALAVSERMLGEFLSRWEPPSQEGERFVHSPQN